MRKHGPLFLVIAALLVMAVAPSVVQGASPNEGTIATPADDAVGKKAEITYDGAAIAGALLTAEVEEACVIVTLPLSCDEFTLHLNLPLDYYAKRLGKVVGRLEVSIDWSDAPSADQMDIDLLVVDSNGTVVGSSTEGAGVTTETAEILEPPPGDYRIVTAASLGTIPAYKGAIRFFLDKAQPINTVIDRAIKFGPATVVNPSYFGGEPMVTADHSVAHSWWIDWPIGSRSNTGQLYRSIDGGTSFKQVTNSRCPERRQPGCITSGGGDTATMISKKGVVYFANQEALANEAVNVSLDHGVTWPSERENAISSLDATNDRMWLATYGEQTAYISASVASGTGLARTDDAGQTWVALNPITSEVGDASSPMVVDETGGPNDGTLYMLGRGLTMHVSRDKGETFANYPSTDLPNTGPAAGTGASRLGTPPPWMDMDTAGNLYVAWVDPSDGAVHMSTMNASDPRNAGENAGSTWSAPVRVSIPPAVSNIFAQIVAGDPGRVAITWDGADATDAEGNPENPSNVTNGPWYIYTAITTNALCQWDNSCPTGPAFKMTKASERTNHVSSICIDGTLCAADPSSDRNLLDFFDLGIDEDGRVGISWTDDNHGLEASPTTARNGYIMFALLSDGPSLYASKPSFSSSSMAARSVVPAPGTVVSRAGDAVWPLDQAGGHNYPTLDLLGSTISMNGSSLDLVVNLASTTNLADGLSAGFDSTHVKYLTRWAFGNDIYFVAADTTGDATEFYGGKIDSNDEFVRTGGTSVYGTTYVRDFDAQGQMLPNGTIKISVPLASIGNPKTTDTLYSVQSFAMASADDATTTVYTAPSVIDATPALDYSPATVAAPNPAPAPLPLPKVLPSKNLPGTGVGDDHLPAAMLLLAAAVAWRFMERRRADG